MNKTIDECKCPKCNNKLLTVHSVIEDDIVYDILCVWCGWKSKEYETKQEAIDNYETEIL